jgi:tRNA-splicing ligase RtcB (3'-phosphate/5'-hydroxy nucleic acid ligase)
VNVVAEKGKAPIKMWTDGVPVEQAAMSQLRNTAQMPFIFKHIAVMPDVHLGIGATVGSVIPTRGAIIPAAVGVDIGCGMIAALTGVRAHQLPSDLKPLRRAIESLVPVGPHGHEQRVPRVVETAWGELEPTFSRIYAKHPKVGGKYKKIGTQLGSLGGGNHFIEICLDQDDRVWIMLHSGSRNIGNVIGHYFIELARQDMRVHHVNLPDRDLAYLSEGTQYFNDYVEAVEWAQKYALKNRELMLEAVTGALEGFLTGAYGSHEAPKVRPLDVAANCHHNYVRRESHFGEHVLVTRKGAVSARDGEMGIIPGSMGVRSYIVRGKGNPESFTSCSHGAGRRMSRTAARKAFTRQDHVAAVAGVECRTDEGVLDETPGAYKDIDAVIAAQTDLIEVVHTLKQIVCVKG